GPNLLLAHCKRAHQFGDAGRTAAVHGGLIDLVSHSLVQIFHVHELPLGQSSRGRRGVRRAHATRPPQPVVLLIVILAMQIEPLITHDHLAAAKLVWQALAVRGPLVREIAARRYIMSSRFWRYCLPRSEASGAACTGKPGRR